MRDVEVLLDRTMKCDWEMRTLPLGVVQVMLGTGRPPKVQFNCTLPPWTPYTMDCGDCMGWWDYKCSVIVFCVYTAHALGRD